VKAAIVREAGKAPVYAEFEEPHAASGEELIQVAAAPLSHVTKARASGTHYSASAAFPFVAGLDGVGRREDGGRVYFFMPRAPFGSMAARTAVNAAHCVPLPDDIDDVTAAAIAIPAMSSWAALKERAKFVAGESVLINGATGTSGRLAVRIARHLGAERIIATGRDRDALAALSSLGADAAVNLKQDDAAIAQAFAREFERGVDVVLDYLWGPSAEAVLTAAAKAARPLRFVQIGSIGGAAIPLPAHTLRSFPLDIMGSGIGSVPMPRIRAAFGEVLRAASAAGLTTAAKAVPLADVEQHWPALDPRSRTVFLCRDG
jgi:NADPH:quinone reductase-like Zn-dependent oxidoreductase